MKKSIATLAAIIFTSYLFAGNKRVAVDSVKSTETFSKHELCLGYNNPFNNLLSFAYWDYFSPGYYNFPDYFFLSANNFSSPSYGVAYKYHPTNRIAFRASLDLNSSTSNFNQTRSSGNFSPSRKESYGYTMLRTSVGLEIDRGEGRSQWFAGGDLFYQYSNSKYTITDVGTLEDDVFTNSAIGISPLIGVRYFLGKKISLSAESKLNIFYNNYKIDYTNNNGSSSYASFYTYEGSGLSMRISPIGQLGVNIHF